MYRWNKLREGKHKFPVIHNRNAVEKNESGGRVGLELIFTYVDLGGSPGEDDPGAKGHKGVSLLESHSPCADKAKAIIMR